MARLPNPRLALDWRERLSRFAQSELTVAAFCDQEGCSTASFYQWRRKLQAGERPQASAFVPVALDASRLCGAVQRCVEIDLPGGATVRVPGDATAARQRELIAAIVQATCAEVES